MNIPNAFRDRERFCNPNRTKYKDSWIGNSSNSRQKHCLITLFFMLVNRPLVVNLKKLYICITKKLKQVYYMTVQNSQKGKSNISIKRKIYQ